VPIGESIMKAAHPQDWHAQGTLRDHDRDAQEGWAGGLPCRRYPHEFSADSGSASDRARAALRPKFIICDEPSRFDVSIQSQVLNILKDLQQELG